MIGLCLLLVAASATPASGLVVLVAPSFANVRGTGGGGCGGWGGGAPTSASQQNLCNLARTCRPTQMCPVLPGGCSTRPAVAAQCGNSAGIRTWFQRGGAALQSGFGEAADRIRQETQEREAREKELKKKREAAKIQAAVKKRKEAREQAETRKKEKVAAEVAMQRAAAASKRAEAAAKRKAKATAAIGVELSESTSSFSDDDEEKEVGEDDDDDEEHDEDLALSEDAVQLLDTVKELQTAGKSRQLLQVMDNVTATLSAHSDQACVAGAVVKSLLSINRPAYACEAIVRAEAEGYPVAWKLLVAAAKAVSVPARAYTPEKKPLGRLRGKKKGTLQAVRGDALFAGQKDKEQHKDGVEWCLELVKILQRRGVGNADGGGQSPAGGRDARRAQVRAVARVYAAAVNGLLRQGRLRAAKDQVQVLRVSPVLNVGVYKALMRGFGRLQSLQGVLEVLDVMRELQIEADAECLELVANVAVHDVTFVKGAVSMQGLPEGDLPEACFAGRSNVGKSSLVNMVCNRKKLAFTSKTPGKTQEFNYFLVSGGRAVGRAQVPAGGGGGVIQKNQFHLVDLPGVGYAEVPNFKREEWKKFYEDYLTQRTSLRVMFQLVDGRHGAMKDDLELMKLIAEVQRRRQDTQEPFKHVLVLTKMDKRESKDVNQVMALVREELAASGCEADAIPIVLTSSLSKAGRSEMWRYLRLAAGMGEEEDVVDVTALSSAGRAGGDGRPDISKSKHKYPKGSPKFKGLDKMLKKIGT